MMLSKYLNGLFNNLTTKVIFRNFPKCIKHLINFEWIINFSNKHIFEHLISFNELSRTLNKSNAQLIELVERDRLDRILFFVPWLSYFILAPRMLVEDGN